MPVTVVVGGQFGSEGKGKVAHYLAKEMNASVSIRCGGPNSGHTVIDARGKPIIFQQLPTASILPKIICVLCAGFYIDLDILKKEIKISGLKSERLYIDPNAVIITPEICEIENNSGLTESIGSTGSGTGEAIIRRIQRKQNVIFAKDISELNKYLKETQSFLRNQLSNNERIIIEGTQGFGLSMLHSCFYPYVTSRDTTAAAFVSESGLSPFDVDDIVLTIRAFPIRVGGNSGPLSNEITWETITKGSGAPIKLEERTSVTKKIRRVALFDPEIVINSILVNKPSMIVLNHLDYLDWGARTGSQSLKVSKFIKRVERDLESKIDFIGFGPEHLESTKSFIESHIISNK
jgi:adenylosuccinate synthase